MGPASSWLSIQLGSGSMQSKGDHLVALTLLCYLISKD